MKHFQNQNPPNRSFSKKIKKIEIKHPATKTISVGNKSILTGICSLVFYILIFCPSDIFAGTNKAFLSDEEISRELIRQSIWEYPSSCPCPQSYDRAGKRCGNRSAYSRCDLRIANSHIIGIIS